jgi:hypothetical protein
MSAATNPAPQRRQKGKNKRGWRTLSIVWVVLFLLLPVTVNMKEGTATLVATGGKSLDIDQINKAVKASGFTAGLLRITVIGAVKEERENLLLDVRNSPLSIYLIKLKPPFKQHLLAMAKSGAVAIISGTMHEQVEDLPAMVP